MGVGIGDIFFCPRFPFKDKTEGIKYLVLLNSPQEIEPYIFCKTTSQQKNKPLKEFCQPDRTLFLLKENVDYFPKNTWLQFYELYGLTLNEFLDLHKNNGLEWKGKLKEITCKQIRNCIKKCKKDIGKYYLKFLFD